MRLKPWLSDAVTPAGLCAAALLFAAVLLATACAAVPPHAALRPVAVTPVLLPDGDTRVPGPCNVGPATVHIDATGIWAPATVVVATTWGVGASRIGKIPGEQSGGQLPPQPQ